MASRQSVNSILKPSKVRAPLKEIEPVDQDDDENTESLPKRKVSFSGMNKIKMYNTGATSLTVHQAPMFDEQISVLSDSSNAEKTKLLEVSQKYDYQMTSEPANCTTVEENNHVNIEYECQNDNMEMTEALSCKIFSDAIYTIDNNGVRYGGDYNSDYLDSNMELTEIIKSAQIITHENELDFSSTETFNDNDEHTNVQSSNMELTCVASSQKSILQYCESDMELTELTTRKIHENNNCKLFFEQDQHSISTASETTSEISMDIDPTPEGNEYDINVDNAKLVISEQKKLLVPITIEYEHNIDIDQPRISIVSTGSSFINEMLVSNINKPERVEELKEETLNGITSAADQCQSFKNNKIKNYSRKSMAHTPLVAQEKSTKIISLSNTPVVVEENDQESFTESSITFVQEQTQSLEKEKNPDTLVMSNSPTSSYNESLQSFEYDDNISDTPVIVETNQQTRYSRKSVAPTLIFNESQYPENEETSNISVMIEENQQMSYSKQSNPPVQLHNKSQSFEDEDNMSDIPVIVETNQQTRYSRKSVAAPMLIFNESQSSKNKETSKTPVKVEENQQNGYSQQSNSPVQLHNKSQSFEDEDNMSDIPVIVKTNQQTRYSRKSVAPTMIFNESQYPENEETSNISVMIEENQQMSYSKQSNPPVPLHHESQSSENEDNISVIPVIVKTNQQKRYSRKSVDPTSVSNQSRSTDIGDLSDTFVLVEGNYQRRCSIKSSIISVPNKPKKYSRKTLGPSSIFVDSESPNDSMSDYNLVGAESSSRMSMTRATTEFVNDISLMSNNSNVQPLDISNKHKEKLISKIDHESLLPSMIGDDDLNSPFRKKSRLSVALTNLNSETANESNLSENYEDTSKMDISIELSKDYSMLNISSEDIHKITSSSSPLNDILLIKKPINKDGQFLVFPDDSIEKKSEACDKLSRKEKYVNNLVVDDEQLKKNYETSKEVKNDHLKVTDNINLANHILKPEDKSFLQNVDGIRNEICIEGISNISISEETHINYENSLTENRKRSYSNRDDNCGESANVPMKEEQLNNEVLEFLTRWKGQFIDKLLVQVKCTNNKWIFSALDGIIVLTITYLPILKDHTFLKVDDITFTSKTVQHEITKFGMNWILSKYNPKVYKQVCFSSRDIELLLKSLLEDVQFINKVMDNMFYISDLYCVTFKDNIAQIVLHSMKCLSMTCIQISLSNIHKLSVKDITADCLFGFFNANLLNDILEKLPKNYNILESLIIQLKDQMYS